MKKTLAAVAILGAFAGSAMADVTVYGRIDTGLLYTDDGDKQTVSMEQGQSTGGRWGLKGSTAVSDTTKVGFVVEGRIYSDTGVVEKDGKTFEREATIHVAGPYGTVYAGRINSFFSDGGSVAMFSNYAAFGTGSNVGYGTGMFVGNGRTDNTIAYVSPSFGGLKVYAEYAMGADKAENESTGARHYGLGLEYKAGAFGAAFAVMQENEASAGLTVGTAKDQCVEQEDQLTVNAAVKYDFGVAKAFVAGQYFEKADAVGKFGKTDFAMLDGADELEGYAVNLGAEFPVAGGALTVGGTYTDFENKATAEEFDGYNVAAQYVYPFSKQVQAYVGAGYVKLEGEGVEVEKKLAMAGMVVRF